MPGCQRLRLHRSDDEQFREDGAVPLRDGNAAGLVSHFRHRLEERDRRSREEPVCRAVDQEDPAVAKCVQPGIGIQFLLVDLSRHNPASREHVEAIAQAPVKHSYRPSGSIAFHRGHSLPDAVRPRTHAVGCTQSDGRARKPVSAHANVQRHGATGHESDCRNSPGEQREAERGDHGRQRQQRHQVVLRHLKPGSQQQSAEARQSQAGDDRHSRPGRHR